MRRWPAWVLFLAWGSALAAAAGEPPGWSPLLSTAVVRLTVADGLPSDFTTSVAEDGRGFIWIGTLNGLARWDGRHFRTYGVDKAMPGSLPDGIVQTLHVSDKGDLWLGTAVAGLVRYDAQADRFVRLPVQREGDDAVGVKAIADDGEGGLLLGTPNGVDRVDPATGRSRHLGLEDGVKDAWVEAILRDRRGGIWLATGQGLLRRRAGEHRFAPVPLPSPGAAVRSVLALFEDSGGRVWVGTRDHGVFVLEGPDASAGRPLADLLDGPRGSLPREASVLGFVEAGPGEMWFGTRAHGVYSVDLAKRLAARIDNVPNWLGDPVSLQSAPAMYRDRSGLVWVATSQGVSRQLPRQAAVANWMGPVRRPPNAEPVPTDVSWILPHSHGSVWIGTHHSGIEVIEAATPASAFRLDGRRVGTALPGAMILGLAEGPDGSVYAAAMDGLYRVSADTRQVQRLQLADRDPRASTWAVLAHAGTLWIGGKTDGLWGLDLQTGRSWQASDVTAALTDRRITALAIDGQGKLWIGTRNGLNRYEPRSGRVSRHPAGSGSAAGLSGAFISSLQVDASDGLWVGSFGGGVDRIRLGDVPTLGRRISTRDGLPDNTVNALLADGQGRMWVSTDRGLAAIDPGTGAVHALRRASGVGLAGYWTGSAARLPDGRLLFGGAGGLTIVRPEAYGRSAYQPLLSLTGLKVGGVQQAMAGGRSGALQPVEVRSDANQLEITFAADDFAAPEQIRYAYRLQGLESGWTDADAAHAWAAYSNLPPGRFVLQVRATNRDGVWSPSELALPVAVEAAWHQTGWARWLAGVLAVGLVAGFVRMRTRLLRARQAELESKVRERTAELEQLSGALEQKSKALEELSSTDPLTGLSNRRHLAERIDADLAATRRRAASATRLPDEPSDADWVFLVIDVDRFKRFNDEHGHAAGDAVLRQVAQRLRATMRESDYVVRWGGEEFLAVARDTDRSSAPQLAERLRAVVADDPVDAGDGSRLQVTCSIGFACAPFWPGQPEALGWEEVVGLADMALLAAKRSGRDAWVGLHARAAQDAVGLATPAALRQALGAGRLASISNRPAQVVQDALLGAQASVK